MNKEPKKPGNDQNPPVTLEQKLQKTNMKIEVLFVQIKTQKQNYFKSKRFKL
ncbi:hypothetical protein [Mycoplasmopsis cynos]|uniref:hypothetical protein n=1 Tax=Mycoplasmopsis cynos TaxID=171284 RepID=UPI002201971F|nr:hypothetical protein [Mycoplasmopsis cynos]UWV82163.1 hypothetical protein NW065_03090 [Mycoplasmopsis cynos]